ncbi:MAG TPA: DUF3047 domain-containing protein [Ramlibacter sp.]|jgi:hypothetical protein|uniref:DUF3047 domain-containing protein n=1 Tax=Ramlibacter sp. TaxID=1917967 RepID=UPI002D450B47|nr:DUF3047 domain-containing protein [Ramlibacter sp.]HZY19717.1 DUF3047 domain-containing protein [Ramlibacter sp.]
MGAVAIWLAGCASTPGAVLPLSNSPWAQASLFASETPSAPELWEHQKLPGKTPVQFHSARVDGRDALAATAVAAASVVRHRVRIEPDELGSLRFSWKVPQLIASADMALRDADDSPVRVILAFEGDRRRLSARDTMLSDLMRTLTGEEMPYATLMYVWCNKREPGSVIHNPRTDRIRKLVVESGSTRLDRWLDYERDVRADYERVFGEPPGALVGIALMTDSDNTRTTTRAWYGPLRMQSASADPLP